MAGFGSKSSMELRLRPRPSSPQPLGGGGPDLISALPDDLLLLVLARLPCAGAAARTGVLSRRWRGLWARLRRIVLRDVPFHSLQPALASFPRPPPAVSLLEIRLPEPQPADIARVNSLLRAAALLDPEEFFLVSPSDLVLSRHFHGHDLNLPCFHRATSIVLDLHSPVHSFDSYPIIRSLPAGIEFPALETLSMSSCVVDDSATLLSRCPRLRTLRLTVVDFNRSVLSFNSPTLEELDVVATWLNRVNIIAPMLKRSTISLNTNNEQAVSISISAPMVEKLSWDCYFSKNSSLFGLWRLLKLSLQAAKRQGKPPSLQIHACIESPPIYFYQGARFAQAIEKRLIAAFSVLELNLENKGHAYGAFVCHVLEVNQICWAMQSLKVDLRRLAMEEEGCPPDCLCQPTDWKSQTIPLTALEEVEVSGFHGKDHEFDFLKLILRSAPMLKRMTIKLSREASTSNGGCTKVYDIFKEYSSVLCNVYLSSGSMHGSRNCAST
uniref:Uncharacterized protein n=2 Tax=Avena sativa TaxID=4498 RepID=A0ACD5YVE0_AVESA